MKLLRTSQEGLGSLVVGRRGRRLARALEELSLVGWIGGDAKCLLKEGDRLVMGSQRRRALGGTLERQAGLRSQGIGLGSLWRIRMCRQVVASQGAGQLVRSELLEVTGRGKVAGFPILLAERVVGDFSDQRLKE